MSKDNFNYLNKNYEQFLKKASPQEKLSFLENTILKRKSLIVTSDNKKKKTIQKRKEKLKAQK